MHFVAETHPHSLLTPEQLENRRQGLTASKFRRDGLWRILDQYHYLITPDGGMTTDEAEVFLQADRTGSVQS